MDDALDERMTIGAAAERLGVATSLLRYYEGRGLIQAERTDGGQRRFARDVLRRVSFIRAAQQVGLPLAEIEERLATLPPERAPTVEEWEALAAAWQPRLDDQIRTLIGIRDGLARCIGCGCLSLDACHVFNPADRAAGDGPGPVYLTRDAP